MEDWFDSSYNLYSDGGGYYTGNGSYGNGGGGGGGGVTVSNGYVDYGDGTSEYVDPTTGDSYYYDTNTGETSIQYADGSTAFQDSAGNWIQTDPNSPTVTTTDTSGGALDAYGDGTYGYTAPDGTYTFYDASGGATTQNVDGTIEYTGPNGEYESYDAQGNILEQYDSEGNYFNQDPTTGASYYQDAAGNWVTVDANGFKCWGDSSGGQCCDDGSCSGAWANKTDYPTPPPPPQPKPGGAGGGGSISGGGGGGGSKPPAQQPPPGTPATRPATPIIPRNPQAGPFIPGSYVNQPGVTAQVSGNTWIWIGLAVVALFAVTAKR